MAIPSLSSPPSFQDPLPDAVDVVVIGGGVVGVSTALFLAEAGIPTLLCEKGRIAGEQSSRNWGWIRQQGRDLAEIPLMRESRELWMRLSNEVGDDIGLTQCGCLYLAETHDELAAFETWLELARPHQLDSRMVSSAEINTMIDAPPDQWIGGLHTPSDCRAEPFAAVPAFARLARDKGARIVENCAVRAIDTEAGRVAGVVTESGRVRARSVVCAAGAWTSLFARRLGIDVPQLTVKACVARTTPGRMIFEGCAAGPDLAFRLRRDGGYTVALPGYHEHFLARDSLRYARLFLPNFRAHWRETKLRLGDGFMQRFAAPEQWAEDRESPFERTRILDPSPTPAALRRLRKRVRQRLPGLGDADFVQAWAGMIEAAPDNVPMIGETPSPAGFFIATGFSGHGFGIGPAAGRIVADLVRGNPPGHDLHRFRLDRFEDGSVVLGPSL